MGVAQERPDLSSGLVMKEQTEGGNLRVEKRPHCFILKIISWCVCVCNESSEDVRNSRSVLI